MAREIEKRRIANLIEALKGNKRSPDISRLSDEQRTWYINWKIANEIRSNAFERPDEYYESVIQQDYFDNCPLRQDIKDNLFGKNNRITINDSPDEAVNKYENLLKGIRHDD